MLDLLRFFSFLSKDEPVPEYFLHFDLYIAVKKFLDFSFFLFFFFRRCFPRKEILNLFFCFLSLYFIRIFHLFYGLSFFLHRTFLSSSSISSSEKRILVRRNYWIVQKIISFFSFHDNETLNRFIEFDKFDFMEIAFDYSSVCFNRRLYFVFVSFDWSFRTHLERENCRNFENPVSRLWRIIRITFFFPEFLPFFNKKVKIYRNIPLSASHLCHRTNFSSSFFG